MKFEVEVGDREKHTIEFNFNQLLGRCVVSVDGHKVFAKQRWFSEPIVDQYELEIGGCEIVRLRIEKRRKQLVGSKYAVYVDDRLTQLHQGV